MMVVYAHYKQRQVDISNTLDRCHHSNQHPASVDSIAGAAAEPAVAIGNRAFPKSCRAGRVVAARNKLEN